MEDHLQNNYKLTSTSSIVGYIGGKSGLHNVMIKACLA